MSKILSKVARVQNIYLSMHSDVFLINFQTKPADNCFLDRCGIHQVVPIQKRLLFEYFFQSTEIYDILQHTCCYMCQKHHPSLYCSLCHINLCKCCARTHLFGQLIKYKVNSNKRRWSVVHIKHFSEIRFFRYILQNISWCQRCGICASNLSCEFCQISLCTGCLKHHFSDNRRKHEIIPIRRHWSLQFCRCTKEDHSIYHEYNPKYFLYCHMCYAIAPKLFCDICRMSLCDRVCSDKHCSEINTEHNLLSIKRRFPSITDVSCDICDKTNPKWSCTHCRVNLCIICAGVHLSDLFRMHAVLPIKDQSKHLIKQQGLVHRRFGNLWCQICHNQRSSFYCSTCCINLCKVCTVKHLFKNNEKHKIVKKQLKNN